MVYGLRVSHTSYCRDDMCTCLTTAAVASGYIPTLRDEALDYPVDRATQIVQPLVGCVLAHALLARAERGEVGSCLR